MSPLCDSQMAQGLSGEGWGGRGRWGWREGVGREGGGGGEGGCGEHLGTSFCAWEVHLGAFPYKAHMWGWGPSCTTLVQTSKDGWISDTVGSVSESDW